MQKRFAELGGEIEPMSPEELGAYVKSEHEKWAKVVKASGAKVDRPFGGPDGSGGR